MTLQPLKVLVAASVAAVAVEAVAVVGWWTWRETDAVVRVDPGTGARLLAEGAGLGLPPAVVWSRRLTASDLRSADLELARAAFLELGTRQCDWMPTDPEGLKNLSRAAFLGGDVDGAVEQLGQALARDPTAAYLHRLMALMLRRAGRSELSLDHLAEARAIAPSLAVPEVELTPAEAEWVYLESFRRRVDMVPNRRAEAALEYAKVLTMRGRFDEAIASLTEYEGHPKVQLWRAERELDAGDPRSALDRVSPIASLARYPTDLRVRALSLVARARADLGDEPGAMAAADEAVRMDPDSPWPFLSLAVVAEKREDWTAALVAYRRAWGVDPNNVRLMLRLAVVAERARRWSDARYALERAVEASPDDPEMASRLVGFLLRRGQFMDATLELSRFLERFPTDPTLLEQADRLRREVAGSTTPG